MVRLLVDKIKASKNKTDTFTFIQCLGYMSRAVGNKIAIFLNDIFPILQKLATQLNKEQSIDIDNEITEVCLSTFENLIKKCPKEIGPYIQNILAIAKSLLGYDPNYTYNENEDQIMQGGDD